jgi:predicted MFS family arabinose efflux permease
MTSAPRHAGDLRDYALITGAYWADTITDGASRMLVLFYFDGLGYSPFEVASLFLFYEVFGIITNLVGGWLAARLGLRSTLLGGLAVQLVALGMLGLVPASTLSVAYVMVAQALSGIAKDLTKMSAKSAVKLVVPADAPGALYKWVTILTGSKNALKGVGFFLGALGLTLVGFRTSLLLLGVLVAAALLTVVVLLRGELGRPDATARFRQMFSNDRAVNVLAAARIFLFAARDVWFVVGLPVYLHEVLGWSFWLAGGFLAAWTIGYGLVQALAPRLLRRTNAGGDPDGATATRLAFVLAAFPALIALALATDLDPTVAIVVGLLAFGAAFALNSAVHSYLILAYADGDKVAMNVGFYYMANAGGRLAGTVLSGALYQWHGLEACLWASTALVLAAGALSRLLPAGPQPCGGVKPGGTPPPSRPSWSSSGTSGTVLVPRLPSAALKPALSRADCSEAS